jgi:6-phosphogluconolactonase
MINDSHIRVATNAEQAAGNCAVWILGEVESALKSSNGATLAISGGSTPKLMFDAMSALPFDWSRVHLFWVDERCVPPDDPQSNYKLAKEHLIDGSNIPAGNIHRIRGEQPPEEAADEYTEEIRTVFRSARGSLPSFDVIHRGIGDDAHTASLFPGEPLIGDRTGIASHVYVEKLHMDRVTLLPGVLIRAKKTVLLAAGADKAEPIANVLRGPEDPFKFPCQIAIRGADNAFWFIDESAAARL